MFFSFLVHGIGVKLVSHCEQKIICTKKEQFFCRKRVSVLTDLKGSPLPSKCILQTKTYGKEEPMELKFEGIKMRRLNLPMVRAQRVDERNGVICLFIMFTPEVMVMKMSNMAHLLYFLLMTARK